jgi:hypothetical protein
MKKDGNQNTKTGNEGDGPTARTMLAASKGKYPLRIAYALPHLKFPIGDGQTLQDRAYVTGLLDTGGCYMMGKEIEEAARRTSKRIYTCTPNTNTHAGLELRRTEQRRATANKHAAAEGNGQENDSSESKSETDEEENLPKLQRRRSQPRQGSKMDDIDSDDDSSEESSNEAEGIQAPRTLAASATTEEEQQIAKLGR